LEHLVDPWAVLKRQARLLKPDGQVIACIPNVQHWSMAVRVLRGDWVYEDSGLMDRTHLRYFSLETIVELFRSWGLHVLEARTRSKEDPDGAHFLQFLQPALNALQIMPQQYAQRSQVLQYVVQAVKEPPVKKLLVETLLMAPIACDRPRILEPDRF